MAFIIDVETLVNYSTSTYYLLTGGCSGL